VHRTRRAPGRRTLASLAIAALLASAAAVGIAAPAAAAEVKTLSASSTVVANDKVTVSVTGAGYGDVVALPGQQAPSLYLALIEKDSDLSTVTLDSGISVSPVAGDITGTLTASASALDRTKSYEVIAWPSRSFPTTSTLYARSDVTIDWNALLPKSLQTSTTVVAKDKATVEVTGSGYTNIPQLPGQAAPSLYLTIVEQGADLASVTPTSAISVSPANGLITGTLERAASTLDRSKSYEVIAWPSRSLPTAANLYARADVTIDWNALFPIPTPTVSLSKSTDLAATGEAITVTGSGFVENAPATNGTRQPLPGKFGGAYVVFGYYVGDAWTGVSTKWAVHQDDIASVGGAARGAFAVDSDGAFAAELAASKPASAPDGARFGVRTYAGSGSSYAAFSTFTAVSFAGVVPEPEPEPEPIGSPTVTLDTTDLDPNVANTLTVKGTGFTGPAAANGAYVGIGATALFTGSGPLPAEGWITLDWVMPSSIVDGAFETTLTVDAGELVPGTAYQVVTSAAHGLSATDRSLDTFTPVTVKNVTVKPVINLSIDTVLQGGALTVTGAGLEAGKTAVVTVNSDPYELGRTTVGADGRFSVTGTLPATFATGSHTVTVAVDGVVLASAPLTVAAALLPAAVEAPQAESCTARAVSGASISWNVKESFRSYIEGSIANGSYSVNWGAGSGAFNTDDDRGRVAYSGSASFTGHSGVLDMNLSNPRIQVTSPTTASLILDVRSAGYGDNAAVSASGVTFATLRLPTAAETADRISWNGASATLTAAGAEVFAGFYEAGTALDPVSFSFPLGAEVECDTTTSTTLARTGSEQGAETLWIGLGLLLLGAGAFALRRRTARV